MELGQVLYLPYQLIRRPLATVDRYAVRRLSPGNPVRSTFTSMLGVADAAMSSLLDGPTPTGVETISEPPGSDHQGGEDESAGAQPAGGAPVERTPDPDEQRRRDFARKQGQVTRANHTAAAMRRDLARMDAVVEAREALERD